MHIDIDPSELNKNKEAHIPIVQRREVLRSTELNKIVEAPDDIAAWVAAVHRVEEERPVQVRHERSPASLQQHAIAELSRLTQDRDTIVTVGVGQHQMWAAQFYKFQRAAHLALELSGLGTMGFGLPAAMGAQGGASRSRSSSTSTATAASR